MTTITKGCFGIFFCAALSKACGQSNPPNWPVEVHIQPGRFCVGFAIQLLNLKTSDIAASPKNTMPFFGEAAIYKDSCRCPESPAYLSGHQPNAIRALQPTIASFLANLHIFQASSKPLSHFFTAIIAIAAKNLCTNIITFENRKIKSEKCFLIFFLTS